MSTPSKFLAIDASTERCSVAVSAAGTVVSDHCDTPKSHAKVLLPMVDALLSRADLQLSDLDAILVGIGPGSFTGIRIGISVAQGLSYGANVPLYGSVSLETLAYSVMVNVPSSPEDSPALIIPCLDARMSEVYWAVYCASNGVLEEVNPPQVSAPQILAEYIKEHEAGARICGGGHGWDVPELSQCRNRNIEPNAFPHAPHLIDIWRAKLAQGCLQQASTMIVEPLYLRNDVSWNKRKRVRSQSPFLA